MAATSTFFSFSMSATLVTSRRSAGDLSGGRDADFDCCFSRLLLLQSENLAVLQPEWLLGDMFACLCFCLSVFSLWSRGSRLEQSGAD